MNEKDFLNFEYLQHGCPKQQAAFNCIMRLKIPNILNLYSPTLAGTIPINISTDKSDLDILCYVYNHIEFQKTITCNYSTLESFEIKSVIKRNIPTTIARFCYDGFLFEIFGQNIQIENQFAFIHMVNEYKLLKKYGPEFSKQVIELKTQGFKTEPAFAKLLNLKGNPYDALLEIKIDSHEQ